jgi:hypothetical protein
MWVVCLALRRAYTLVVLAVALVTFANDRRKEAPTPRRPPWTPASEITADLNSAALLGGN